jgi:hypothetical protein
MTRISRLLVGPLIAALALGTLSSAEARDAGQWGGQSPEVQRWFQSLMQPDHPMVSCCGEADGFPVDHWESAGPDGQDFQVTLEDGRSFFVPSAKAQWRYGNPTGKDILFVGAKGTIYCFVMGSGT